MAYHKKTSLTAIRGLTGDEIQSFIDAGLLRDVQAFRPGQVRTTSAPSKWPKWAQTIWYKNGILHGNAYRYAAKRARE